MEFRMLGPWEVRDADGPLAERFIERGEEERVEAVEAEAGEDLAARVDGLALRARELAVELEALRGALAVSPLQRKRD